MVFDKTKSGIDVRLGIDKAVRPINTCSQPASQPASQLIVRFQNYFSSLISYLASYAITLHPAYPLSGCRHD